MNKEEILARSRNEKTDEGMVSTENKGRTMGLYVFVIVFIFIYLFNFFSGQPNHAPSAMFWAFLAAEAYPKYQFTQNKLYLITTIAGAIASAASLVSFVLVVLKQII